MILSKTNLVNVVVRNIVSRYQNINISTNTNNNTNTNQYTNLVKAVVSGIVSREAEQLPCSMNSVHLENSSLNSY